MVCQASLRRWPSAAWLGMALVAGGTFATSNLGIAGGKQSAALRAGESVQSAAKVNPADQPSDQGGAGRAEAESPFRISVRKSEDRLELKPGKERLLIVVRSPSGIGSAVIERTKGQWPAELVVRLYLRGLESFRAATQEAALSLSVLSHGNHDRLMKLSVDDRAQEIKPGTPTGVEVRAFDAEGKPVEGLPPAGGWFEVHLPRVMFSGNPAALRLEWIDFYRG